MSRAEKYILTLQDASAFGYPLEAIMEAVCRSLKVGRRDVMSLHRLPHIVEARHIFCWFARYYTARSYPVIGNFVDRDHATVMYGVRKVQNNLVSLMPKLRIVAKELGVELNERAAA